MPEEPSSLDLLSVFTFQSFEFFFDKLTENAATKFFISFFVIVFHYVFYAHKEAMVVLFSLVMIDTITGGMLAYKRQQFSSAGFFRFANKMVVYLILLATASLVDKILPVQFSSIMMISFMAVTEAISIAENLKKRGAEVPGLWIAVLIRIKNKSNSPSSDRPSEPRSEDK